MDDYSRLWYDDVDDLDAEAMNDLEVRQEARVAGNIGEGIELGYVGTAFPAETVPGTFTTTSTATLGVAVTGLTVAVTVGSRPIDVIVSGSLWNSDASFGGALLLRQDGTTIGTIAAVLGDIWLPLNGRRRLFPAAGSHTYAIYAKNASAGTLTIKADDAVGANNGPAAIQVVEV